METNRLEAFSDGVMAIAITLLVLDLPKPADLGGESLAHVLAEAWASYASYIVSFFVIGIIWVNHHAMFRFIARADRMLLFLNLVMLLFVTAIPWPTALLAEHINNGSDSHVAAAIYSGVMFGMSIGFSSVWRWAAWHEHLLDPEVDVAQARRTIRRFSIGLFVYLALVGVAFVSAPLTLALHFVLAIFYVFNQLPVARTTA